MDTYAWFELDGEPVRRLVVDPDEEVELTLQGFFMAMYGLEYGGRLDPAASSGIVTLDVTDEGGYRSAYFDDYLGMTDEDGKITVSFDAEGTYCLSAFDEESDMALPLLPPWLEIVVGQDYADITDAKALVESTAFTATQAQVSSIAAAKAKAESVIGGLALNGVSAEVVDGAFTAAVAGTSGNPAGTNGSYTFTVTLNKGDSAEQTTASLTLAITATPYVYVPPGPTWPDGGSTAGGGVNPPDTGASGDIGSSAKITVKLNVNGGKGLSLVSQTYAPGDKLGTLPSPARKGYRFAGWYSAKSGGTKLTAESVVPAGGDFGIYAHWTAKKYTVKLNVNGGKALAAKQGSKTVAFDAKVGKLPTPKRPGYVFKGWYTAKEGGKRIGAATVYELMSGKTLYAHWAKEGTAAAGKKAASAVNRIA
jgi:uncharacterized repeat protein (TIGR02543 family)